MAVQSTGNKQNLGGEGILSPLGQEFPALGTNPTEREPQESSRDGNTPGTRVRLHFLSSCCWNWCLFVLISLR